MVRTIPAQQALRAHYRDARISWLVERKAADFLRAQSDLDEVLLFPREELSAALRRFDFAAVMRELAALRSTLRAARFDLVVDFHAILKSGVLGWLTGAPLRASYKAAHGREWSWVFANRRADLGTQKLSRHQRNRGLVEFLAVEMDDRVVAPEQGPIANARFASLLAQGRAPVLIHPGSSPGTPYKRYTEWGYSQVARRLVEEGYVCWIVAGNSPEEVALAERIVEASGKRAELAPKTPTVSDLAALARHARLFVGSDSGPLHLAALLETPVVQIIGPTDPVENEPLSTTPWRRVQVPVPCSPCRRGCADATCMKLIAHDLVLAAARELLAAGPGPGSVAGVGRSFAPTDGAPLDRPRGFNRGSHFAPAS